MVKSKTLKAFQTHFDIYCNIRKPLDAYEDRTAPHWKRLRWYGNLNSDELEEIAKYIKYTFSNEGKYTHLLPVLGVHEGFISLTVDEELIQKYIIDKQLQF